MKISKIWDFSILRWISRASAAGVWMKICKKIPGVKKKYLTPVKTWCMIAKVIVSGKNSRTDSAV